MSEGILHRAEEAQSLVAALLRRYLSAEKRAPSTEWRQIDDGDHLAGTARILEILEADALPPTGDPLAVIELEWRAVQAKHRAFSRYDSIFFDNPGVLEEMAQVMRRWPSLRFERGNFNALCPGQYETCMKLGEMLERKPAVALDGIRAKLRYQLEMRDVWEEAGGVERAPSRRLLERSIARLDSVCPDPMLEFGYRIAESLRDERSSPTMDDLEQQGGQLHATTLEGALVHVMLAMSHLDRDVEACKQHMAKVCRVLEAHTGLILEELGGTRPHADLCAEPADHRTEPKIDGPQPVEELRLIEERRAEGNGAEGNGAEGNGTEKRGAEECGAEECGAEERRLTVRPIERTRRSGSDRLAAGAQIIDVPSRATDRDRA